MRVTSKGQVTIPRNVREVLGIAPETDIEFKEEYLELLNKLGVEYKNQYLFEWLE